jgi:chromosome segregation ATPase
MAEPNKKEEDLKMVDVGLGNLFFLDGKIDQAIKHYEKSGNQVALLKLGEIYSNKDNKDFYDMEKAIKYYNKCAEDFSNMHSCMELARIYMRQGKLKKSLTHYGIWASLTDTENKINDEYSEEFKKELSTYYEVVNQYVAEVKLLDSDCKELRDQIQKLNEEHKYQKWKMCVDIEELMKKLVTVTHTLNQEREYAQQTRNTFRIVAGENEKLYEQKKKAEKELQKSTEEAHELDNKLTFFTAEYRHQLDKYHKRLDEEKEKTMAVCDQRMYDLAEINVLQHNLQDKNNEIETLKKSDLQKTEQLKQSEIEMGIMKSEIENLKRSLIEKGDQNAELIKENSILREENIVHISMTRHDD